MHKAIPRCGRRIQTDCWSGVHINFLGETRSGFPGFRVAAYGLARNDGSALVVIPAKAGIQETKDEQTALPPGAFSFFLSVHPC
jgi:hypothetical protein